MVRRAQQPQSSVGRIRFVYAEVEGNDETLQNLITTMAVAMGRGQIVAAAKRIPAATKSLEKSEAAEGPTLFSEADCEAEAANGAPSVGETANGNGTTKRVRGEGPKTDRNAGLTPVPDLDLVPDGKASLRDFVGAKKPTTAVKTILVFVYYLAHTLEVSPITANHVLSCFKHIGISVPVDLPTTIRNILKKAWLTGDLKNLRISTEGDNQVEHRLGQKIDAGRK